MTSDAGDEPSGALGRLLLRPLADRIARVVKLLVQFNGAYGNFGCLWLVSRLPATENFLRLRFAT